MRRKWYRVELYDYELTWFGFNSCSFVPDEVNGKLYFLPWLQRKNIQLKGSIEGGSTSNIRTLDGYIGWEGFFGFLIDDFAKLFDGFSIGSMI